MVDKCRYFVIIIIIIIIRTHGTLMNIFTYLLIETLLSIL